MSRIAGFLLFAPARAGTTETRIAQRAGVSRAVVITSDVPIRQLVGFTCDCVEQFLADSSNRLRTGHLMREKPGD
jgi:hypothetical protein